MKFNRDRTEFDDFMAKVTCEEAYPETDWPEPVAAMGSIRLVCENGLSVDPENPFAGE